MNLNFSKPKAKPPCEHFHHVVQRIPIAEQPNRSYVDDYIKCQHFDKRITKRTCIDCKEYKSIKENHEPI